VGRADTTVKVLPADTSNGRDVKAAEQTTAEYGDGSNRAEAASATRITARGYGFRVSPGRPFGMSAWST